MLREVAVVHGEDEFGRFQIGKFSEQVAEGTFHSNGTMA